MKTENFHVTLESDFIDVPIVAKSSEPILLPSDDDDDVIETSQHNASSDLIELLDQDTDNSHNSTAIEDIKMFIANEKAQTSSNDIEIPDISTSLPRLVRPCTDKQGDENEILDRNH